MLLAALAHGLIGWPAAHAALVSGHVPAEFVSLFAGSWLWADRALNKSGAGCLLSTFRCAYNVITQGGRL